jgi:hypothetical protein
MTMINFYSARLLRSVLMFYLVVLCTSLESLAQPAINSFSPTAGPVGTSVTISGANFSATPANNVVFIGGVKTNVTQATTTTLTATVPAGATYQPVSVTSNGFTAYSRNSFIVTFSGAEPTFNGESFEYGGQVDSENPGIETTKYAVGDLDDDKRLDVVTVDRLNNTLSVYRNTTAGGAISFDAKIDIATGKGPRAVTIADIDSDGKPDVIITNFSDNTVSVFKNTTSGGTISFVAKADFATATQPAGLSVTDVDKDGKPDLVINTINLEGYVSILRNTGSVGTVSFASRIDIQSFGGSIEEIKTADLDGDGKPDIVLPDFAANAVKFFRNTSSGGNISFVAAGTVGTSINPDDIEIGDFNDDGKPDLAIGHYSNNAIRFYKNVSTTGNIALQFSNSYPTGSSVYGLAVGDLDGDAKLDIAVNADFGSIVLLKNTTAAEGELTFDTPAFVPTSYTSDAICGDFDNDGKTDIASNAGTFRVSIWINSTAKPKVFSFLPSSGKTGDAITITGSKFTDATAVSFGGVPAASFTVDNATTITAVVGAGATGDVAVVSALGSGKLSGFLFLGPPVILDFTPGTATSSETVVITGQNFTGATAVKIGGVPAEFNVVDPFTIEAIIGTGASGEVSVTNPYGTATKSGFVYIPKPFIYSFTPAEAATGATVTITGLNLSGTTSVSFGDTPAASFNIVNPSTVKAVVGNGSSGSVRITNAYGTAEMTGFTYYPPPVITSFTPVEAAEGERVTITGLNFSPSAGPSYVTSVEFGGTAAYSFTVADATTIVATVDSGSSGPITVKSAAGSGSLQGFTFINRPTISSVSPRIAGPGSEVTITGQHLARTTAVTFGDTPAKSFTIVSDNILKVIIGTGANGYTTVISPKHTVQASWVEYTAAPLIYGISPKSGPVGTTVTISGINFQPGAANNTVYFGGVKADILSVTADEVIVTVPPCAGYQAISVISPLTQLAATTDDRFNVTFPVDADAFNEHSFAGKMDLATGSHPSRVKHADINSDGKPDIIITHNGSTFVSIYKNESSPGRLSFSPRIDIEIGIYAKALTIADLDADGKLDLIISNDLGYEDTPEPKIYIFRNQSTSENIAFVNSFALAGAFYYAGDLATGDFDLDGRLDIAFLCTNCSGAGTIQVSKNTSSNGSISFAEASSFNYFEHGYTDNGIGAGLTVSDFNHDHKPDVLVGMSGSSALYAFINISRPGEFLLFNPTMPASSLPYFSSAFYTLTPCTATLDSDPYPDVVSGSFVFKNSGSAFSEVSRVNVWYAASACDLNGDGKPDILGNSDNLLLLKNTSAVNSIDFANPYTMDVPGSAMIAVGDLDGDSKPEICLAYPNTLTILRNRMGEATPPEPTITSFSPQTAEYANEVVIEGNNLSQVTSVTFGGVPALYFTITSDNSISATISNGSSGSVSISSPGGTASLDGFTFIPAPAITSFTPKQGISGTAVTISGVNFNDASEVSFGGVAASSFTVESPERIVAVIGNGASGRVGVTTPVGTGTRDGFMFYGKPVITSFTPTSSMGGGQVVIYGSHFEGVASVSFGGVPASAFTVHANNAEITATVGTGASGSVAVTNPAGTFSLAGFTFIYPAITSFTPTSASTGTTVTIKGHFFSDATAVSFGGVAASSFTVVDAETITAVVGSGASGSLSVTTPAGTAMLDGFTYSEITAIDPDNAREKDFMVSPNPTRDILVIRHPATAAQARLLVIDMLGREVKTIMPAQQATQTETSMIDLVPGIYTIIWSEGIRKLSRVFVVQ